MLKIGEDDSTRIRENKEFNSINLMRRALEMTLLKKGWVTCVSCCSLKFFTFNTIGNHICEICKGKPRSNSYQDFDDAYSVVGV